VVVGVGGFLGIGEREVAVRFDSLQLTRGADQRTAATLNASKEALKAAPEWKWSAENGR
jgi:phosphate-selective porin